MQPQQQQQPFSIPIKVDQPKKPQQPQQQQQNGQQLPHPPKRPSVMERLRALEMEMSVEAAGLRLPEDPELTDKLSAFLGAQHPDADLQITVSSVRRTTTTKQQYETVWGGQNGREGHFLIGTGNAGDGRAARGQINGLAEEIDGENQ
jgi:hypothetical protein